MQDVQILVMPHGYITQCPDLNRSTCRYLVMSDCGIKRMQWSRRCILLNASGLCRSLSNLQRLPRPRAEDHGASGHLGQNLQQGDVSFPCNTVQVDMA